MHCIWSISWEHIQYCHHNNEWRWQWYSVPPHSTTLHYNQRYTWIILFIFFYCTIEPDPIDNASIVLSFTDRGTAKIEWGLTLLQSSTIVRFSASCLITECSSGVIINNVSNSSYITNLIDGLNYTLFLMAANVLGNSSETEFHIIQNRTGNKVLKITLIYFLYI